MAKNLDVSLLLDYYGALLTDKQREVAALYYNEDYSLAEIAEHAGITRQGVRDCIKRAECQLLDCEEKLGHVRRFGQIQQGLDEIAQLTRELMEASQVRQAGPYLQRIAQVANELNQ